MSDTGPENTPAPRPASTGARAEPLTLRIGHDELVIRQRYEAVSIANDILIAVWFIVGSIMFFSESWTTTGTWCFLLGSIELLIRPVIRLSRQIHLQKLRGRGATTDETSQYY